MKPDMYAQALFHLMQKGTDPKDAVAKVHAALEARGRVALLPQIARAFRRLAEREARKNHSTLTVANKQDEKEARVKSGAKDAELVVDENVIGGWRLEDKERLVDTTFRKQLLSIYNGVVEK